MSNSLIINLVYVLSSFLFIVGLKNLSSPATARKGNLMSSIAMFTAVVATLYMNEILSWKFILISILAGSIVGALMAGLVAMTAMPEMVALLNGFGGACKSSSRYWSVFSVHTNKSIFSWCRCFLSLLEALL